VYVQLLLNSLREMGIINDRIEGYFRCKLLVKVGRINCRCLSSVSLLRLIFLMHPSWKGTHDRGLEWRLELLLPQLLEVNMTRKEWMIPNVLCSPDTQSLCRIPVEQLSEEITSFRTHSIGESKWIRQDFAIHFIRVFIVEWG
jgi:hypothetical protein